MKKLFNYLFSAIALVSLASCASEIENPSVEVKGTHTVKFIAESVATKTTMDDSGSTVTFAWEESDLASFHVFENGIEVASDDLVVELVGSKVVVKATFDNTDATSYEYTCFVAKTVDANGNPSIANTQTFEEGKYDSDFDVLVAKPINKTRKEIDFYDEDSEGLSFQFTRVVAISKMTLKNLNPGDELSGVKITCDSNISGYYDRANSSWNYTSNMIDIYCAETVPESGEVTIAFVSAPFDSKILSIEVFSEDSLNYTKTFGGAITIPVNQVTYFGVDLTGCKAKPQPVDKGTILWKETWGEHEAVIMSSATLEISEYDRSGTTCYGENSIQYSLPAQSNTNSKIYYPASNNDTWTVLGHGNEFVLAKTNGSLQVSGIPTGYSESATLTFLLKDKASTACSLTASEGVTISSLTYSGEQKPFTATAILAFDGISQFNLTFSNSSSSANRIDEIMLTAGTKPIIKAQYNNIAFKVGTESRTLTYSLSYPENSGDEVSIESNASWISASIVDETHFTIDVEPAIAEERTGTVTLSATGADDLVLSVTQASALIENPSVSVEVNDAKDGFSASWASNEKVDSYDCFYSTLQNATSGTDLQVSVENGVCSVSVSELQEGVYYLYVRASAKSPYISPNDYSCTSIELSSNSVELTYDFKDSSIYPSGFPTSSSTASTSKVLSQSFTVSDQSIEVNCNSNQYMYRSGSGTTSVPYYLMFGKCISSSTDVYIELPIITGKKLTKVDFYGNSGASTSVYMTVVESADATVVVGASKQYTASNSTPVSWTLSTTSATKSYRIVFVGNNTTKRNVQCTKIYLKYE